MKKCSQCKQEKDETQFYKNKSKEDGLSSECKNCIKQSRKTNYNNNIEYELERSRKNREQNSEYYSEKQKQWRQNNPDRVREVRNRYQKLKWETDVSYKLRQTLSKVINQGLKSNGSSKDGMSCSQYLPYSFEELREHLEKQFEPWMTWNNWGIYDPEIWDENDQSTWTWQIDHIIPHSTFNYTSMKDEGFRKCWSLDNLRPLSAKRNILDGVSKKRHIL